MTDTTPADLVALEQRLSALEDMRPRIEALEAWTCRRPGDAIPQPFIDKIAADAIASVSITTPAEEVPDGPVEDDHVQNGE
jgi:hypothetical protein